MTKKQEEEVKEAMKQEPPIMNKPTFTDEEINELCDLYADHSYNTCIYDIINFLEKELGYSKVSNIITELRKEFSNKRGPNRHEERSLKYPNSTLQKKLLERLDFNEKS